ncbi:LuxR family transcriptional regulator [Microtetraspora sp. NBRC 16547]|uniref:helix-turn-helix transcriptional regulator n=1 Tax=Microtetraspora sp. NBRC 16547 TaxID=3030993 RepID=UPI0024A1EB32|nr:LuxR family transcriptional regulator [Microtetraspora sp. NBRC 16547]GLW97520.1 hypothetical protein Misp02_16070 [Microtetraspora sp. NBRC 16547]
MRACELAAVAGLLERAGAGEGGTLLIDGEPGTGKTTLLSRAAEQAATQGFSLAAGAAEELDRLIPLNPLLTAFDDLPAESDPAAEWLEARLERLRIHMEKRMVTGPLLVTLDDLHWADPATLMAVRTLHCRLAHRPLAWMLTRSTDGPDHETERLFDVLERQGSGRIALSPLPDDAVARIVADLLHARPEPGLLAFASGAGGNPYLLVELVNGLRDEGVIEITGGDARLLSPVLPRRVRVLVRHRLDRLGREARHLVEAAAVLGRSFSPDDVAELLGASPATLLPAMEEALAAGLLVAAGDDLAFRHELVWRAVLAGLPRPLRLALRHQAERHQAARLSPLDHGHFDRGYVDHGDLDDPVWTDADRVHGQAVLRARAALASGRLDEAGTHAEASLGADDSPAHVRDGPVTGLIGSLASSVLVAVALRRGDLRAALAHAPARPSGRPSTRARPAADLIRAMAAGQVIEAGEGAERAMEHLLRDQVYSGLARRPWVLAVEPACAAWLVRLALRTGDRERAELVVAALDRLSEDRPREDRPCEGRPCEDRPREDPPTGDRLLGELLCGDPPTADRPGLFVAVSAHVRGLLDDDPRALALAADRAADPWSRASAEEDLGMLLCRTGDRTAGVERLNRALAGYEESAAVRDGARVRRRLRQEGVRRRHWTYADRPVAGWDSLTDTERTVSLLVAQGWTNRKVAEQMFISVHTVAFHLRQIFRKLDIRSRVELTRLTVEHAAGHPSASS